MLVRSLAVLLVLLLPVPALAQEMPRHGDVPDEFGVAMPMVGDAGAYERSIVRFDGESVQTLEAPHVRESFRIEAPRDHYDMHGLPHRVNTLHSWIGWRVTTLGEGDGEDIRYFVDATDGALVASQYITKQPDYYTNYTYFPGLYQGPQPCGLENVLQRGPVSLGGPVHLFASACRRAYYVHRPVAGDPGFAAVRADPWGDGTAVGFQQLGSDLVVLVWFTPEVPYPVRLLEQLDQGLSPRFAMLELTGFTRGDTAVAQPGDLPTLRSLPPVRLAPHGGDGPDESGVQHPYPWSQAWSSAKEDVDVRAFLDDHAQATVRTAVYNELAYNTTTPTGWKTEHIDRWWFVLDDGRTAQRFDHDHTMTLEYADLPLLGPVRTGGGTTTTTEPNTWDKVTSLRSSVPVPTSIPVVADAITWWEAVATPHFRDQGANGWLYNLGCAPCTQPWGATGAGRLRGDTSDDGWRWEASYVSINWKGELTMLGENVAQGEVGPPTGLVVTALPAITAPLERILAEALADLERLASGASQVPLVPAEVGLPLDAGVPGGPVALARSPEPAQSQANSLGANPSTVALVVAGGVAAVAGLAWLVKVLGLGLFSRLRRDRALDHPVRRAIMEAVEAQPGIHLAGIQAVTGKGAGVARHHIAKLVEAGLVSPRKGGGYLCYFPGKPSAGDAAAAAALKADGARRVLRALGQASLGIRPIATRAGLAPSTVEHHLARLAAAGLVERQGAAYAVTAAGRSAA